MSFQFENIDQTGRLCSETLIGSSRNRLFQARHLITLITRMHKGTNFRVHTSTSSRPLNNAHCFEVNTLQTQYFPTSECPNNYRSDYRLFTLLSSGKRLKVTLDSFEKRFAQHTAPQQTGIVPMANQYKNGAKL